MHRYRATTAVVWVSILMGSGLLLGSATGSWAADRATDPYASLDTLAQALTLIETRYVDEIDEDALVEAAVRGMAQQLDPHSRWLDAEETRRLMQGTEGSYEGIGIETKLVRQGVRVERVFAGGPSERSGLLAGDILTAADDISLVGLPDSEVTSLLQGPRGEPVDVTLVRAGVIEPITVRIVRDRIVTDPVEAAALGDIAYVRLMHFQQGAGEAVSDALMALRRNGATAGVVLDLRDNPGGILDEAVAVSDLFLDDGPIVSTRGRSESEEVHPATPGGIPADVPVVVLVNGHSASASEIVAGALQDTGRATLVGQHTYGKGSVQVLFETRNGGALKLTTALYYTPSGAPVAAGEGRSVDVQVALNDNPTALDTLRDAILQQTPSAERDHLLALLSEVAPEESQRESVPWGVPPTERVAQDRQLARAVQVLRDGR